MGKSKRVKIKNTPNTTKKPRKDPAITDTLTVNPVWQTAVIDLDGRWSWKDIESVLFFNDILPKIQFYESMTWHEILGRNSHEIKVEQISPEAKKRLVDLNLDDFETLVSLRLKGKQRVWGIKISNVFKILWWDPNHEVYPSMLKNT